VSDIYADDELLQQQPQEAINAAGVKAYKAKYVNEFLRRGRQKTSLPTGVASDVLFAFPYLLGSSEKKQASKTSLPVKENSEQKSSINSLELLQNPEKYFNGKLVFSDKIFNSSSSSLYSDSLGSNEEQYEGDRATQLASGGEEVGGKRHFSSSSSSS
jgi:hypothetical protein